jgi:agmatine deiminase
VKLFVDLLSLAHKSKPLRCGGQKLDLVPDYARHSFCWMAWAVHPEWGHRAPDVENELHLVVSTISRYETVRLLTPRHAIHEAKSRTFGPNVEIIEAPVDDIWMRDIAPVYARDGDRVVAIDLNFNGWGATKDRPSRAGDRLAGVARSLFGPYVVSAPFVGEGGAFCVADEGVVLTTRSCLLNPNRNPFLSVSDVEAGLKLIGARKVIWLEGDAQEPITSGHVDGIVLPTESGILLTQGVARAGTCSDAACLKMAMRELLPSLNPIELDPPHLPSTRKSKYYADSYVNIYTPNGAVIAPCFGDEVADFRAEVALRCAFPNRAIHMLRLPTLASGGGGIRCLVQPVPMAC